VTAVRSHAWLRWLGVAVVLVILFCIWFYANGFWEDLQYD